MDSIIDCVEIKKSEQNLHCMLNCIANLAIQFKFCTKGNRHKNKPQINILSENRGIGQVGW